MSELSQPNSTPLTTVQLSEDEFDASYPLITNPFNPSAGWVLGESGGCLFDTVGEQFDFVRTCPPSSVWTLVDGDDGDLYLVSGLHFVNRIGYLVSKRPVPDGQTIEVHLLTSEEE